MIGALSIRGIQMQINTFQPMRILSAANAADLVDWVQYSLSAGTKAMVIDFRHVFFMDNSGISTLVTALKAVQKAGARLGLCGLNGQARMMLETAGIEPLFEIYQNIDEFEHAVGQ
jgi:anti-anti-sigma factor